MNINRNNYEEYFLLYADNELSPVEKKVVEIFVQENIDLKEEFFMIQLTLNSPDEQVKLLDKSFLLKEESPFIHERNYEEIFVLYHDKELSNEENTQTEQFIKEHPQFNIEFSLIEKSKLSIDENIVFPGKIKLYRKEKGGRVIPLILWRSIAAAVFIGFGLWATTSYFNKKEGIRAVAFEGETIRSLLSTDAKIILQQPADTKNITIFTEPKKQEVVEVGPIRKEEGNKIIPDQNANAMIKEIEKKKILAAEETVQIRQENREIAVNDPIKNTSNEIEGTKATISTNEVIQHVDRYDENIQPPTQVQDASYASDNNSNAENYVFYNVTTEEFNKTKVGGFLKKVKRIVERSNPITRLLSGDDKQVASK